MVDIHLSYFAFYKYETFAFLMMIFFFILQLSEKLFEQISVFFKCPQLCQICVLNIFTSLSDVQ